MTTNNTENAASVALQTLRHLVENVHLNRADTECVNDTIAMLVAALRDGNGAPAHPAPNIAELRLGLGQIAAQVFENPTMAKCCARIDALLGAWPHSAEARNP